MADTKAQVKVVGKSKAQDLIDKYKRLLSERANFDSYWQSLHDYFYIEAADINTQYSPGNELTSTALFDSTSIESADVLAAGFMNYLTPPTSRWFRLRSSNPFLRDNKNVMRFWDETSEAVNDALNKSNFHNQNIANYKSSGVYGTSAMLGEEDNETEIRFYSLPIRNYLLVEDGRGRVSQYYLEFEFTAYQAATRWGMDKLSSEMQEELQSTDKGTKKHKFILAIYTRHYLDVTKTDKKNLPIEACWVDVEGKTIIEEGGYNEFPAFCHRFDKRPFIPWGFSPAMKALPFARTLNAIAKTNLRAMMKHTDPPIAVPDNAFIMPFNTNPRAVNYYNKNKMDGSKDIFAFANFGDPNIGLAATEYYANKVKALMYNDVFLAFDSITKQMNNPEVMERISEKMSMLGPAVGRYISEMINPIITRTIGVLYRRGKLPPVPDELLMDPQYEVDCMSQLAQAQRRSELNNLITGLGLVGQVAQFIPDALDKISADKVVDETWSILGAPSKVLRDDEDIAIIREARAKVINQQNSMNMVQQGAEVVKAGSEVDANLAKAGKDAKGE